ncbi:MAG TPA: AI-2E family transporter [Paenalcaligenes sp.]|nr:AI-2E family transporter [Paenalcaligenes sp.]
MTTKHLLFFRSFLLLLAIVSIAFIWLIIPFYGAIFWGTILAVLFAPCHRYLLDKTNGRRNLSALLTLLLILLIVIIPVIFVAGALVQEMLLVYGRLNSGELDIGGYFEQVINKLPPVLTKDFGPISNIDISKVSEKVTDFAVSSGQFLTRKAVSIGSNTFQFIISLGVMLYLLYFLLRDGQALTRRISSLVPLSDDQKSHLFIKFTKVVRATVKGNLAVAAVQGALGGVIFWFLGIQGALFWGVLMGVLSLLPAVGASLIWAPVAIYFISEGNYVDAIILAAFGTFVIGLTDNLLRPKLVGKDTKIPDYLILISTLGGLSIFGLNGFVIGPLITAMFMACWTLFPQAMQDQDAYHIMDRREIEHKLKHQRRTKELKATHENKDSKE